jgi:hypothetical protein
VRNRFVQAYLLPRTPSSAPGGDASSEYQPQSDVVPVVTVSLGALNKCLADAFAAVYWYGTSVSLLCSALLLWLLSWLCEN